MPQIDPSAASSGTDVASGGCAFGFVDGWAVSGRSLLIEGWEPDDDGQKPWFAPDRMADALRADEDAAGSSGR